ncbi:ankyrin repeat domain 34Bb [Megalops cyprinoides]|uniref:ankyrin repeat domain 34Bb n=1 Tax=Megalops cyprinoides TaxID=118141 RepID=UPI001863D755|nr:ankyrin repeat domain 34Bb [Megalops cyprinoides]
MEDVMEVRTDGNSLLKAVYLCRLRLTRLLLEGGAYINESNERGETPLMVACKTKHADQQSVPKAKMVKYLLENGADPNIQDKSGKTALMHACLERAGVEVVSLLLTSGADPSLEDHSSSSALVYAVNANDKDTLKVLLDACKAKGKEVIIITTDKLPSGRQMTKQYLNVPPPPDLEDRLHYSPLACMSPSEIEFRTSPLATTSQGDKRIFSFKDCQGGPGSATSSQPGSPTRDLNPMHSGVAKLLHLQRLHSEPWLKIPPTLLLQQNKACSLTEDLLDITPEEELSFRINGLTFPKAPITRHQSIDVKDATGLSRALEQAGANGGRGKGAGGLGRKMSYDDISSSHSASHPDLHRNSAGAAPVPVDKDPDCLPNLAVSSLRNIVQRRNIGMDHYSSDSQLPQFSSHPLEDCRGAAEKRKLVSTRSSTLCGSRESLESMSRRSAGALERRGSGALLLDHISQTRPGYLPPLNPHTPIPDIGVNAAGTSGAPGGSSGGGLVKPVPGGSVTPGPKPLIPCAPSFPRDLKAKKMLLRRHSMQTEQIKQLANFEEIFGH